MTIGSHQTTIGKNDSRFTPRYVFEPLGPFDTDVCAGDPRPWDIATRNITAAENSLLLDWRELGRKWCNAPFNRYQVGQFVAKMCEANHGTLLLHVRTETEWFKPIWDCKHLDLPRTANPIPGGREDRIKKTMSGKVVDRSTGQPWGSR